MARKAAEAFGRYLKTLRERRGLSLLDACRLTELSPEKIDKGTLSRFERGQQSPSLFKLSPLSRIYDAPSAVLIERMELDREVERNGGPETDGLDFDTLVEEGRRALIEGHRKFDAYAYFREALVLAPEESLAGVRSNLATVTRSLGKNHFALHELLELDASGTLQPNQRAVVLDRISNCYRCLGDMALAEEFADSAIARSLQLKDLRTLAFAYNSRANVALDKGDHGTAVTYLHKAFRAYRDASDDDSLLLATPGLEVNTLLMLSDCYLAIRRIERARGAVQAARRISRRHDLPSGIAYSELLQGRIDAHDGASSRAIQRWTRAADMAREMDNRRLCFAAEFELFRQALDAGNSARARASRRRLERLAPWVPRHLPMLREFKSIVRGEPTRQQSRKLGA